MPHKLFSWESIPTEFEAFKVWLKSEILDFLWKEGAKYPSDGVVIEINDLLFSGVQNNQYNTRQKALKFEQWKFDVSCGTIVDIHIEQKRVFKSVRIEIQPMVTRDGCNARFINSFNPSILINNDLFVGKKVYFEKNSDAVNILLHDGRLKSITQEGESDG